MPERRKVRTRVQWSVDVLTRYYTRTENSKQMVVELHAPLKLPTPSAAHGLLH